MICKLAMRYTRQSVLMFDVEYRQCQAAHKFAWGDQAPHLAVNGLILCDCPLQTTPLWKQASSSGNVNNLRAHPARWCAFSTTGAPAPMVPSVFSTTCSSCGKDHPFRDHTEVT